MRQIKKDTNLVKDLSTWDQNKNFMILKLLSFVPEFKKDVAEIRKEMDIKENGFLCPKNEDEENELTRWVARNGIQYLSTYNEIPKDFPSNDFEKKMLKLGTKYRLPANFYAIPGRGLPHYILTSIINAPSNHHIDFRMINDQFISTSLIVYVALSKAELKEAMLELNDTQLNLLPIFFKGIELLSKKRYRDNFPRDLFVLEEQIKRSGKPKKVKEYESIYLDSLSKSKDTKIKELRRQERIHKKDVKIIYDQLTSKQIGKKAGMSGDATRGAKTRLNSLAKELFGYDLEP